MSAGEPDYQSHVLAPTFASCCPLILCYNQHTHPWPISPWLFLFSHSADYRKYTVGRLPFFSLSIHLLVYYLLIYSVYFHFASFWFLNLVLQMHIFRYPSFYNQSVTISYRVHRCICSPVLCIYSVYFDPASSCFLNQLFWLLPFLASPHFLWAPISTLLTWLPAQIFI